MARRLLAAVYGTAAGKREEERKEMGSVVTLEDRCVRFRRSQPNMDVPITNSPYSLSH